MAADFRVDAAVSRKDVKRASKLLSSPAIKAIADEQKDEPGSVRLLISDSETLGALVHRREEWEIGAAKLKVARLHAVSGTSGEDAFRHTGDREVFDALVGDWCRYLSKAGYHLAFAHGELALWPVHEFVPCFFHPRVYIPTAKALKLKPVLKVRNVMSKDAKAIAAMMAKNRHLRPRVFATGVPNFHHYAVEGPKKRIYGYFSMSVTEGNGQPPVFIPEVEIANREAAETILAHAAPYAEKAGMKALHFPLAASHPFASACLDLGGYHQIRGTTRDITLDEEMIRVIDVKGCLDAMHGEFGYRLRGNLGPDEPTDFVLAVGDEKVPVRYSARSLRTIKGREDLPQIRLPLWAFTQLLMGYRSPQELRHGTVRPLGGVKALTPLFPKTWPLSLCDHDLWDPSLRDRSKYGKAAMAEIRKLRYSF
ncbi:MAG: hypothetical protein ABFS86_06880 [Planctomycetota bacterium]